MGVCKTRNPPGTFRNHPEPAGTTRNLRGTTRNLPGTTRNLPEGPGTFPEPLGTFIENQNNKNQIKVIKKQNENNKTE